MKSERSTRTIVLLGLAVTVVLCTLYLAPPPSLEMINQRIGDAILFRSGPSDSSGGAAVVDVDEVSLACYGQWPWPRDRLALLLRRIHELGAVSIGLEMILSEPDRTSPLPGADGGMVNAARQDPEGAGGIPRAGTPRELPVESPAEFQALSPDVTPETADHDTELAGTLSRGPYVLGYEFLFTETGTTTPPCALHPLGIVRVMKRGGEDRAEPFFEATGVVCNLPRFAESVTHSGFLNATPDPDGVLRRIPLLIRYGGRHYPSLALAALLKARDIQQVILRREGGGQEYILLEETAIPLDRQGNIRIDFATGAGSIERVSAADVLDGRAPDHVFQGKIVFVGASAAGLEPLYHTGEGSFLPHSEIHARVAETILCRDFIWRNAGTVLLETAAALILVTLYCLLLARLGAMWNALIGGLLLAGAWQFAILLHRESGVLFSPLLPALAVAVNFALLTIFKYWSRHRHARAEADQAMVLLKTSENKLDSIVKTIPDIVYRLDPSGRITFLSASISKYDRSPDELIGRPIIDLVAPEDQDNARYRINERRTGDRATTGFELRLLLSDQPGKDEENVRYFSVSAKGLYAEEQPSRDAFLGTQGIARDITEQKRLERQLAQAQKMEAVGTLASGIAHDFNNILQAISGFASLMMDGDSMERTFKAYIHEIELAAERGAELVRRLLAFSRKVEPELKPLDLNREVIHAAQMLRRMIPKMIAVETRLDPELRPVMGDANQLEQVLLNLGANARDAIPEGGVITIETRTAAAPEDDERKAGYGASREGVELIVSDNGEGIEPDVLERIFDPFFTTKAVGQGTGLGLSMVYGIVTGHGGTISCRSRPGEGTTFSLRFPAMSEAAVAEIESKNREAQLRRGDETILVVDDEEAILEIASTGLAQYGYTVRVASSGEDALRLYRESDVPIHLVLLDVGMPGMGGKRCLEELRALNPDVKVIVATGYAEDRLKSEMLEAGADAFLSKPYRMKEMLASIGEVLARG